MSSVGTLQETALRRKDKLQALRNIQKDSRTVSDFDESASKTTNLPKPVFRSYQPQDEGLKEAQLTKAKPLEVLDKVKNQFVEAEGEPVVDEVDLVKLAPKKPDWDLKRDIDKKLKKLERRTQRAIAELIRERLQGDEEDLASAVSGQTGGVDVEI